MATRINRESVDEVRAAMDQLLAAEREAQEEIESARERARDIMREARASVQQVEERARRWRGRIHRACEQRAEAEADRLRREAGLVAADAPTATAESALVKAACERLAARLTEPR
jgi:vacuolar-type H+-ATPase subunit H